MLAIRIIAAILLFLLAGWQFYASWNSLKTTKRTANANTSPFILLGVWTGFIFGILCIVFGILALTISF